MEIDKNLSKSFSQYLKKIFMLGGAARFISVLFMLFTSSPAHATLESVTPLSVVPIYTTCQYVPARVEHLSAEAACKLGNDGQIAYEIAQYGRYELGKYTIFSGLLRIGSFLCDHTCIYTNPETGGRVYSSTIDIGYKATCPTPINYPTIPYKYLLKKNKCEREVTDSYIITLSGNTTTEPWQKSQDPNHDRPESNLSYQAIVKDQNYQPKANIKVTITTDVTDNSGGHMHTADRPKGRLKAGTSVATLNGVGAIIKDVVTDGNGVFAFTFGAEEAAGIHTITANCEGCTEAVSLTADVKVDRLAPIPASPFYSFQLPNRDTNHPNTNFLTGTSSKKLGLIANLYYADTYYQSKKGVIPDFVLNDASLEWGGVLDCFLTCNSAMYPSTPWHKAHTEHRRGSVVDVKANGSPGSIVYEKEFIKDARFHKVEPGAPHGSGSGRHFHLRLNNNARE